MREMRHYQKELIKSNDKVIVCNWKRGSGKSYTALDKALKMGSRILYLSKNYNYCNILQQNNKALLGHLKRYNEDLNYNSNGLFIKGNDEGSIGIEFISARIVDNFNNLRGLRQFDYIIVDEYILNGREIKELKLLLTESGQIINVYTDEVMKNVKYILDEKSDINIKEIIEQQIKELYKEFINIEKSDNTTIRREKVLKQIELLELMKEKYYKDK